MPSAPKELIELTKTRRAIFEELWYRLGSEEGGAAIGLTRSGLTHLALDAKQARRATLKAAIRALRTARAQNRFHIVRPHTGPRSRNSTAVVNGMKLCRGPVHPEGGAWLPVSSFYPIKTEKWCGHYMSRCKDCGSYRNRAQRYRGEGKHGYLPVRRVRPYYVRLVSHYGGIKPAARAAGLAPKSVKDVILRRNQHVKKKSAEKVLRALLDRRQARRAA